MSGEAGYLHARIGQRMALSGLAQDSKAGAVIVVDDGERPVYLEGIRRWPRELRNKPVRVEGVLRHRPAPAPRSDTDVEIQYIPDEKFSVENPVFEAAP